MHRRVHVTLVLVKSLLTGDQQRARLRPVLRRDREHTGGHRGVVVRENVTGKALPRVELQCHTRVDVGVHHLHVLLLREDLHGVVDKGANPRHSGRRVPRVEVHHRRAGDGARVVPRAFLANHRLAAKFADAVAPWSELQLVRAGLRAGVEIPRVSRLTGGPIHVVAEPFDDGVVRRPLVVRRVVADGADPRGAPHLRLARRIVVVRRRQLGDVHVDANRGTHLRREVFVIPTGLGVERHGVQCRVDVTRVDVDGHPLDVRVVPVDVAELDRHALRVEAEEGHVAQHAVVPAVGSVPGDPHQAILLTFDDNSVPGGVERNAVAGSALRELHLDGGPIANGVLVQQRQVGELEDGIDAHEAGKVGGGLDPGDGPRLLLKLSLAHHLRVVHSLTLDGAPKGFGRRGGEAVDVDGLVGVAGVDHRLGAVVSGGRRLRLVQVPAPVHRLHRETPDEGAVVGAHRLHGHAGHGHKILHDCLDPVVVGHGDVPLVSHRAALAEGLIPRLRPARRREGDVDVAGRHVERVLRQPRVDPQHPSEDELHAGDRGRPEPRASNQVLVKVRIAGAGVVHGARRCG